MNKGVLLGFFRWILPVPHSFLEKQTGALVRHLKEGLALMADERREAHKFAVRRLIETGRPLDANTAAAWLDMPPGQFNRAAEELEKNLGLLKRNAEGQIVQAYPVTLEKTPHRVVMSLGEEVYGAGATGALTAPYVLGQLRGTHISGHITTGCAYCRRPIHIIIDSRLSFRVIEHIPEPLLFVPFTGPGKAIDYLRESVFYCSEEHAGEQRKKAGGRRGIYLTIEQGIGLARRVQGVIFGFPE